MFTGIIEEKGIIKDISKNTSGYVLTISCSDILSELSLGASVAVNGVCQTVIEYGINYFKTELSNTTLEVTNFKNAQINDKVNLERALQLSSRLDGHIVTGHIDSVSEVVSVNRDGFSIILRFKIPQEVSKYIVKKGSIAINGVSLTVADVINSEFTVAMIPTTIQRVNLSIIKPGDLVNIETDILAKYVENIFNQNNNKSNITIDLLKENGF